MHFRRCDKTKKLLLSENVSVRAKRSRPRFAFANAFQIYSGSQKYDPSFHKKYMEAGALTFVAHCTQ